MSKTCDVFSKAAEENIEISKQINNILLAKGSKHSKVQKIRKLLLKAESPLAKSHIKYYLDKFKQDRLNHLRKFVLLAGSISYLVFRLFGVYWYFYPPQREPKSLGISLLDLIGMLFIIPIGCVIYWIVKRIIAFFSNRG